MIMRYNETAKDASLVASSVSTNYPVENILDSMLSTLFRTDLNSSVNIVFDCGAAVAASSLIIDKHNITADFSFLKLQGNSSDSWTSPPLSIDLTWSVDRIIENFSTVSYRYWRIVIEDLTNPDGYIQIGRAWLGEKYETCGIGVEVPDEIESLSVKSVSVAGNTYTDKRDQRTRTVIRFPKFDETTKAEIKNFFQIVDIGEPFYLTFDKAGSTLGTIYVTLNQSSIRFTRLGNTGFYTTSIEVIQEL